MKRPRPRRACSTATHLPRRAHHAARAAQSSARASEALLAPTAEPERQPRDDEPDLLSRALPLLDAVALATWRRTGGRIELEELASTGRVALVRLLRRFDPAQCRLEPYLNCWLGWAMRDAIRRETRYRRAGLLAREPVGSTSPSRCDEQAEEAAARSDGAQGACAWEVRDAVPGSEGGCAWVVPAGDLSEAVDPAEGPEQIVAGGRDARRLWRAVAKLPERERRLVEAHYRCDVRLDRLAKSLGISKSRASRLHHRALDRLGRMLDASPASRRPPCARRPRARPHHRADAAAAPRTSVADVHATPAHQGAGAPGAAVEPSA